MSRARYALAALLAAAVAGVVVVAVLGPGHSPSTARALPKGTPLVASASLFPQSVLFGESVHVRLDAVVDRSKLDPNRVRLQASWSPYTPVAPLTRRRLDVGRYTKLSWAVDVHCVVVECVPQPGSNFRKVFEPTTLHYAGRVPKAGSPDVTVTWPELIQWSRLDPIDPERKATVRKAQAGPVVRRQIAAFGLPWHVDSSVARVSYTTQPGLVFWGGLAFALVLVAASALLLRPFLPGLGWLRPRELSQLELALAAVERARGETTEERKALELLAAELRRSGRAGLAWSATELAWSASAPEPEQTGALAERVRDELAGRTNGHRA